MNSKLLGRALMATMVASLMAASYFAGAAQSAGSDTVMKLNSTIDLLTKAQALLNASETNRQGYGNVEKAKASVANAINETAKAVKANGG